MLQKSAQVAYRSMGARLGLPFGLFLLKIVFMIRDRDSRYGCGAQKLVMQQRGKCGVTLRAQVRQREGRHPRIYLATVLAET